MCTQLRRFTGSIPALLTTILLLAGGWNVAAPDAAGEGESGAGPGLEQARSLRDAGHLEEAAAAYREFIGSNPETWQARGELAQVLITLRQLDGAEAQLRAAIGTAPREGALWSRLAQVHLLKADMPSAERALTTARDLDPRDPAVRYNLGRLYERQARDPEALGEYLAFLELAGDDPRASAIWKRVARYYEMVSSPEEAITRLRALGERPHASLEIHQALADLLYRNSRFDEALVEYQKVLEKDPSNAAACFNVGFIAKMRGNFEEAERMLGRADSLRPGDTNTIYHLGSVRLERGDAGAAAAAFEKVVAAEPDHPQAHYLLARALTKLGRTEEARREIAVHQELQKKVREKAKATSTVGDDE